MRELFMNLVVEGAGRVAAGDRGKHNLLQKREYDANLEGREYIFIDDDHAVRGGCGCEY